MVPETIFLLCKHYDYEGFSIESIHKTFKDAKKAFDAIEDKEHECGDEMSIDEYHFGKQDGPVRTTDVFTRRRA